METYREFKALSIDFGAIGMPACPDAAPYFCTPRDAELIGWAGVDGIHYCFIPKFGSMVFAVSPMNEVGEQVHPLAENFRDFLRLLLACRDLAAMEQAWQWSEAAFFDYINGIRPTEAQKSALATLADTLRLTPMEAPYHYMKRLRNGFDYSAVPFTEEYYDTVGEEGGAPAPDLWRVTYEGGVFGGASGEQPGEALPIRKELSWEGETWRIPAVYVCGKGLVADFCIGVAPEKIRDFMEKCKRLTRGDGRQPTPAEEWQAEREHPLNIDFRASLAVNGRMLYQMRDSALIYIPPMLLEDGMENTPESIRFVEHYDLDPWMGWAVHRGSFPWGTKRKPRIESMTLRLEGREVPLGGVPFSTPPCGETVEIVHPLTGAVYALTVESCEGAVLTHGAVPGDMALPTHYTQMTYRITPEVSDRSFAVRDVLPNDAPRKRTRGTGAEAYAASIGIIGGADGPTAVFLGAPRAGAEERLHVACSALRFEAAETVTWQPVFREKRRRDTELVLL